jgi:hypothetical protein
MQWIPTVLRGMQQSSTAIVQLVTSLSARPDGVMVEDLDIGATLTLVSALLRALEDHGRLYVEYRAAVECVMTAIEAIKKELMALEALSNEHEVTWFASWRLPPLSRRRLDRMQRKLDGRVQYLCVLLQLLKPPQP